MTSAQMVERCPDRTAFAFPGTNGFQTRIMQSGPPVISRRLSEKAIMFQNYLIDSQLQSENTVAERETGYSHENLEFISCPRSTSIENTQRTIGALTTRYERS